MRVGFWGVIILFNTVEACRQLGLRSGAILLRNVQVAESSPQLMAEIEMAATQVSEEFDSAAMIRSSPKVKAFRELLRTVGVNPRKHSPTVERLLQMARKYRTLPTINNLVDAYNLVSLKSRCSLGAHDVDQVSPPIGLRMLTGDESFTPLGKNSVTSVSAGQFGYVDAEQRVVCWLDLLQADFSKVTLHTQNVLLIIEALDVHSTREISDAFDEARSTIHEHCGGTSEIVMLPH